MRLFPVVCVAFCLSLAARGDVRCALDIGSGSTKLLVAEVDADSQKTLRVIFRKEDAVPYKKELTADKLIAASTLRKGIEVVRALQREGGETLGAPLPRCVGVATAVFREAKNGAAAIVELALGTGSSLAVISQDEEAKLGFLAGVNVAGTMLRRDVPLRDVIVWDIGSSSMQITALEEGRFVMYKGLVASDTLTKRILDGQIAEGTKAPGAKSPNPVGADEAAAALRYVRSEAANVSRELAARLARPEAIVIGVGGVHAKSLVEQMRLGDGEAYSVERLAETTAARTGFTDAQLGGGKYAANQFANLVLVLGYMRELGIARVTPFDVNLADGVVVHPAYWKR